MKRLWILGLVAFYLLAVEGFAALTAGGGLVTPSGPRGEVLLVGALVLGLRLGFFFVGLPVLAGWLVTRAFAGRTPRR